MTLFNELTYGEKDMVSNKKICSKFLLDSEKNTASFIGLKRESVIIRKGVLV